MLTCVRMFSLIFSVGFFVPVNAKQILHGAVQVILHVLDMFLVASQSIIEIDPIRTGGIFGNKFVKK